MRMLLCTLVGALAACGPRVGNGEAHWVGPGVDIALKGKATGGWCPNSRTILVEAIDKDRSAGFAWQFDSLRPGVYSVALPAAVDSIRSGISVAARYIQLDEVRGYRGVIGTVTVTAVDTMAISARVAATLQRVGNPDSVHFTATFHAVALARDSTLCAR
jgi:hypothetical protein